MTPRYTCCPSYEGEPHIEDCPAVAEVRRQDAEFRAGMEASPACEGHPAGPYDAMGVTVYCDGSCRRIARRVFPGAMGATEDAT